MKNAAYDNEEGPHKLLGLELKEKGFWTVQEIEEAYSKKYNEIMMAERNKSVAGAVSGEETTPANTNALFTARRVLLDERTEGFYYQFRRALVDGKGRKSEHGEIKKLDYYAVLGVKRDSSSAVIKSKFAEWKEAKNNEKLDRDSVNNAAIISDIRRHYPDVQPEEAAFSILRDEHRREIYDQGLDL